MDPSDLGKNIRRLRRDAGMGLRELSRAAEISAASLSAIENGKNSPTLVTLHRILRALGSSFTSFFSDESGTEESPVFPGESMRMIQDAHREYHLLLPKRADIQFQALYEGINPTEEEVDWETHDCDFAGVMLHGESALLEIEGSGRWPVKRGDAFYVKAGQRHRFCARGRRRVDLITIWYPPRY